MESISSARAWAKLRCSTQPAAPAAFSYAPLEHLPAGERERDAGSKPVAAKPACAALRNQQSTHAHRHQPHAAPATVAQPSSRVTTRRLFSRCDFTARRIAWTSITHQPAVSAAAEEPGTRREHPPRPTCAPETDARMRVLISCSARLPVAWRWCCPTARCSARVSKRASGAIARRVQVAQPSCACRMVVFAPTPASKPICTVFHQRPAHRRLVLRASRILRCQNRTTRPTDPH